ncbi:hemolysin family protein [Paracraurococcus ruber]|uniref:Hemolysin C n=1 Tax=Paracraurococcus ruber TaxID=77675 RepID=A0ABS1CV31_9PROT|nr:hemolysin family protein [Paracraurococcus ruber]MBK1658190.1 hemolysin C [Paracraurococcus ruber]TDG31819.1 HlyC/CorC family transporter [Paracraurococcus ruber]
MGIWFEVTVILLLVALNGAFALSELAIVSARRGRLLAMQRAGSPGAAAAVALADDPQRFLPTVQIGISLVGILAGVFGGAQLAGPLGQALARIPGLAPFATETGFVLVVVLIAYANLILGELVPKQLALRDPERFAVAVARPMAALARFSGPVVWVLSRSSSAILRLFGAHRPQDQSVTEEEVKAVVAEGEEAGALEREERHMIERVLRLADKPVRALMTPRNDVAWIDRNASPDDIKAMLRAQDVNRFVVADRRIDNVVGVVAAKDLLDQVLDGATLSVVRAQRQALVLPDSLPAIDALERMRHDPVGLALVLDEYGSFEGVVTTADLLEAIVGELGPDEPEKPGEAIKRADGSLLLDGMMPSDELRAQLDLPALPYHGTYHTVAGLMLALLRRVPREGDRIVWAGWRFEIVDMDGRRVDKVLASREEATGVA